VVSCRSGLGPRGEESRPRLRWEKAQRAVRGAAPEKKSTPRSGFLRLGIRGRDGTVFRQIRNSGSVPSLVSRRKLSRRVGASLQRERLLGTRAPQKTNTTIYRAGLPGPLRSAGWENPNSRPRPFLVVAHGPPPTCKNAGGTARLINVGGSILFPTGSIQDRRRVPQRANRTGRLAGVFC